jgi:hypothetical protein
MNDVKYFIGPMTKNVVDAVLEFSVDNENIFGFIPSRRQVEYNGGYVNNWNTKQFYEYVNGRVLIERDHSGPNQGYIVDDGFDSLVEDCKYLDCIHIDPWKRYPNYVDGLNWTIKMIKFCNSLNKSIKFEVGTEQSIREFTASELDMLMHSLKDGLSSDEFSKIQYLVIQSGTSLKGNNNTGEYDSDKLLDMIRVCRKYNVTSKEHNGDYIPVELIHNKMKLGLDSINIAPEFGLIETISYIDYGIDIDKFWKICYDSKRWVKWVDDDFNPMIRKMDLIKICGHYVFSNPEFQSIKPNIDNIVKNNIKQKLYELYRC